MPKWRLTVTVASVFASLLIGSSIGSVAYGDETEVTSSIAAVRTVETEVSALPAAASQQMAEANQAALATSVKNAIAAGYGQQLSETTKSPDVRADLLRYGKAKVRSEKSPKSGLEPPAFASRKRTVKTAHSASCYGSPSNRKWLELYGAYIAWVYVRENGWCGSNGRITWYGGPTFADWEWGPYCLTHHGTNYSWDYYPSWIHMANWGTVGVTYPWGCYGIRGIKTVLRIAWSGYYDYYNDYGF